MDNFTHYIGSLVTGVLSADPSVTVQIDRSRIPPEAFLLKFRKKIPLTDKRATYHMNVPDYLIQQMNPLYMDTAIQSDIRKALYDLEAVVRNPERKEQ